MRISRSDTIIGPIKSQGKVPPTNHIQRYSNVHNPINSQKSIETKTKVKIHVPRQVSIPVAREMEKKMDSLRVDGVTRNKLLYSSASSWRNRDHNGHLDVLKNTCQPINETNKHSKDKSKKVLNGHCKNHHSQSKGGILTKRRSKTSVGIAFNMEQFETAMELDNDLRLDSQDLVHNDLPISSVSQMS